MRRRSAWVLAILLIPGPARAADPAGELIDEVWEAAHIEGAKSGFVRTTVRRIGSGEEKRLRATAELDLTFKRFNQLTRVRMEHGTDETPEGTVVGVFMRQYQDKRLALSLTGSVEGEQLRVKVENNRGERIKSWHPSAIGLGKRETLLEGRRLKPGDRFHFVAFEPVVAASVPTRVVVKDEEEVSVLGKERKLLRVEMTPDRLEGTNGKIQLPVAIVWIDKEGRTVRRQIELDGLSPLILTRTSREIAEAPVAPAAKLPDIGLNTLIPLDRRIPRPHEVKSAVFRVTVKGDAEPATTFVRDDRQAVKNVKGNSFELHVTAARGPGEGKGSAPRPGAEYLGSSHFIPSDDAKIKELAQEAVGNESDEWKKAERIERWVKQAMRPDATAPLAPASETARTLRGDCRHYALLTTALCRAAGLPARTALGLVYVERGAQSPRMGFHMWAEVWIDGRWRAIDATLGRGGIGACHLKVSDHSWHQTQSLTPLLPVTRLLGKLTVEVIEVDE